jgi:dTDP-4-dehydrorhamnose 3,5-epimerase
MTVTSMRFRFSSSGLDGVTIVEPEVAADQRGFFLETYRRSAFVEAGIPHEFVQDNHSRSAKGVLRGMHYQDERAPMAKLVRCTAGRVLDVAVDLRVGSKTFGAYVAVELSSDNHRQLFVPSGFAHGFLTLSDVAEIQYKCSGYYAPEAEGSIRWDDPDVGIAWPCSEPVLSPRDASAMTLAEYQKRPAFRHESRC